MSQPQYLDQALTNVSNAWFNQDTDFIGDKIFPEVMVKHKTFKVPKYGKEGLIVPSDISRTGESKAKRVDYSRTYDSPTVLTEKALSDVVTKDDYDQSDAPFNAESDTVEFLNSRMQLSTEKNLATILSDTAQITQNVTLSGVNQWSDKSNSSPFTDIVTGAKSVRGSALMLPNTAFFSFEVWLSIVDHPDFIDRFKWGGDGIMTEQRFLTAVAPYGINKVFIGRAQENSGGDGITDTFATIWGKHFWLGYVTDNPALKQVNGGYKFRQSDARAVTKEVKNNPPVTEIVNTDYYEHILLNNTCFYLIKNAIA